VKQEIRQFVPWRGETGSRKEEKGGKEDQSIDRGEGKVFQLTSMRNECAGNGKEEKKRKKKNGGEER